VEFANGRSGEHKLFRIFKLLTSFQAFSRIYRIGQKKDCKVFRFVISDTVDTQLLLRLQRLKAQECDRVIDGRPNKQLEIKDLIRLFGPTCLDPNTGKTMIVQGGDGEDEFIHALDRVPIDDSDVEETMPAPARHRE
jgi:hypothetical protein